MSPAPFLADVIVVLHLAFVAFVVAGGLLVLRWPKVAWLHVPSAVWGAIVELAGWTCPLTPLENSLRGARAYSGSFVDHYLMPVLYPAHLPFGRTTALGIGVLVINVAIYSLAIVSAARAPRRAPSHRAARGGTRSPPPSAPRAARPAGCARHVR